MEYRSLGRTGVQVSALTLGSMLLHQIPDEAEAGRLFDQALDQGINAVDTANVYGRGASEELLGRLLSRSGRRDRLVLSSKFHARMDDDDPNAAGSSRRHVINECHASLRRLQTDHLDVYYIHRPTSQVPIDETLSALDDLVHAGKIRYIGTSSFAAWQLIESLWVSKELHLARVVVEQSPYSLVDRRVERELLPMARSYGIGITVWSPLAGGLLTGKYAGDQWPQDARFPRSPASAWEKRHFTPTTKALVDVLVEMANANGCTPTQLSLAWILRRPGVSSVVLGMRTANQLEDQLGALDVDFTDEDLSRIDELALPGRATVPYYLDDDFADWSPALHRW
ncbi:MAG TPA: aldo/keto reductase [Jatrophihabitantaceae bacterium]|nr:aldo/keto reductase [Jatrophihabitantaceae bacterium]